jgi:hypothetical protein
MLGQPPPPTTSWINIRRQSGTEPSTWERIRRGEKVNTGLHTFESAPTEDFDNSPTRPAGRAERTDRTTTGSDFPRSREDREAEGVVPAATVSYVPRTREEREELERRRGGVRKNSYGDPI